MTTLLAMEETGLGTGSADRGLTAYEVVVRVVEVHKYVVEAYSETAAADQVEEDILAGDATPVASDIESVEVDDAYPAEQ